MKRHDDRVAFHVVVISAALVLSVPPATGQAQASEPVSVEGQPLAANVERVVRALESLGAPLPAVTAAALAKAGGKRDASGLQNCLDSHVLLTVTINPEERVKVARGPAPAMLQQGGYTPVLVKVLNEAATTKALRVSSPQSGPVTAGAADLSLTRQDQRHLKEGEIKGGAPGRFLQAEMNTAQPMTSNLSGLRVEYALALLYSSESGRREATIGFDVGQGTQDLDVRLERWIDPAAHGYFSGDHHIHAAGCAHYTDPTQGVEPRDMFHQVKGEGLNVGCVLTWGPCYDFQRRFFGPRPNGLSEPLTVIKYDVEVSGFGSQALGHVCLLNLRDQTYPGSLGTATKGWPSWTTPVLRWAKAQGAVTGYAHSGSGLEIDPKAATARLLAALDRDSGGSLTPAEAARGLLPTDFTPADADRDGVLTRSELEAAHERSAEDLPNFAIPEMNGVGAMEVVVSVPQGVCDFLSAMDTPRIAEWNCWYHLLNCGFPLKVSGETDFPCMSGLRVGQGRVYVRLGDVKAVDFDAWCAGLAGGRSYVSDGFAHAFEFTVGGKRSGDHVELEKPETVPVRATVAFAARTPLAVSHGGVVPAAGRRLVGDTVNLHGPRREGEFTPEGEPRRVELVVNGRAVASHEVPADGRVHDIEFNVPIERSSWVALRHFPQLHTNPVDVIVAGRPIRTSRRSALWCRGAVDQLWRARGTAIAPAERDDARRTFDQAIKIYRLIASEAPEGS
ncbi:MAG: CehA/McbA family metallohydrolase [Isosphaerales bacterium]